jgi:hypothetical protein
MTDHRAYDYDVFHPNTTRWPQAGDKLFLPARDTFFASDAGERSYRLLRGYKRAGDILIQHALADRADRENLVFPAIFNYRHYVELALKAIIDDHGAFANVYRGEHNHKLPDLWQLFLTLVAAFGCDSSDDSFQAVSACIDELASVDPNSTSFRYAKNLRGDTPVLILMQDGLDLKQLHDVMNGIANFFECVDLELTHRKEAIFDGSWS